MDKSDIMKELEALRVQYTRETATLELHEKQKVKQEKDLEKLHKDNEKVLTMKELLEQASDEARKSGKEVLSQTASSSLQMVMGDHLSVDMKLGHRSGVPIADLEIIADYNDVEHRIDPHDDGGGLRDLVSLSTFMATGFLSGSENKSPYFLDEPTKFVSEEYAEKTAHAIKNIIDYSGKQAIIVTHERNHLPHVADVSYELEKNEDGLTKVERL